MGENNLLPLQTMNSNHNEEVLAGVVTKMNILLPPNNELPSTKFNQISARMKCYFHHEQNCFLDYFDDPLPDDAVIYVSDVPFQYT